MLINYALKGVKALDNFANIGKAVLIQSLGIQKNYTEIIETTRDVIDYNNIECHACKNRSIINSFPVSSKPYIDACSACENCPYKTYTQENVIKKIYHNEKNRYGYRPMLKGNAIKLMLLLHFYHPDKHGILYNINVYELSNLLKCSIRTIWNNLDVLSGYSYISYSKNDGHTISVILNDYEKYYLPANKNGRGFIVMSRDLLDSLIQVESLISLRIILREIISLDDPSLKGQASVDYKKIQDIRPTLPSYCKPCIIKDSVVKPNSIFNVSINDNIIRFEIKNNYVPKMQKAKMHDKLIEELNLFIMDFNSSVAYLNAGNAITNYNDFFNVNNINIAFKPVYIKPIDVDDLATLALHYSLSLVIEALSAVYKEYILLDKPINNLPGLVSTIIRSNLNNFEAA